MSPKVQRAVNLAGGAAFAVIILGVMAKAASPSQVVTTLPTTQAAIATARPTDTTSPTDTPWPTPAPTAEAAVLGQGVLTTALAKYTVVSYVAPVASTNEFDSVPAGSYFAEALVEECASPTTPLTANPYHWRLQGVDNSQYQLAFMVGGKQPTLEVTTLPAGQCVRGWVPFAVPAKPAFVILANSDLRWRIP